MPKVKFNVNLGSRDATALGLEWQECKAGSVQDVTQAQVDGLAKVGEFVVTVMPERHAPSPIPAPEKEQPKGK